MILPVLFVVINSISDIKNRTIQLWSVPVFLLFGALFEGLYESSSWMDVLLGILPGWFVCIAAIVSRGAVGMGDGIIILVLGVFLGFHAVFNVLYISLMAAAFVSAIYLILGKKEESLPFVPFILIGLVSRIFW